MALDQFNDRLAYLDNLANQSPDNSFTLPGSASFALANSQQAPLDFQNSANAMAQYQSNVVANAQADQQNVKDLTTPPDPVTGPVPKKSGHKGLLGKALHVLSDVLGPLQATQRLGDHVARMAAAEGLGALATGAPLVGGAIGATLGTLTDVATGPFGTVGGGAAGYAAGEALTGMIASLEHVSKGDLSKAWKATQGADAATVAELQAKGVPQAVINMRTKSIGNLLADQTHLKPGSLPYKLVSGTNDVAMAIANDPTTYLAPMLKAATTAPIEAKTSEEVLKSTMDSYKPYQKFRDFAAGESNAQRIIKVARAGGTELPPSLARDMALVKTPEAIDSLLTTYATKFIPDGAQAVEAPLRSLPGLYQSKFYRQIAAMHGWEGPDLFKVQPRAAFDARADDVTKQGEAWARTLDPPSKLEAIPGTPMRGAYNDRISNWMDKFIKADDATKYDMIVQKATDRLTSFGMSPEQIDAFAKEKGWIGYKETRMVNDALQPQLPGMIHTMPEDYNLVMPNYKDFLKAKVEHGAGTFMEKMLASPAVDKMEKVTGAVKAIWMTRPATAIRVAMDTALNGGARYGVHPQDMLNNVTHNWIVNLTADGTSGMSQAMGKTLETLVDKVGALPGMHFLGEMPTGGWVGTRIDPATVRPFEDMGDIGLTASKRQALRDEKAGSLAVSRDMAEGNNKILTRPWEPIYSTDLEHSRVATQFMNHQIRDNPIAHLMLEHGDNPIAGEKAARDFLASDEGKQWIKGTGWHPSVGSVNFERPEGQRILQEATDKAVLNAKQAVYGDRVSGILPMVPKDLRQQLYMGRIDHSVVQDYFKANPDEAPALWGYKHFDVHAPGMWKQMQEGFHNAIGSFVSNNVTKDVFQQRYSQEYERLLTIAEENHSLGVEVSQEQLAQMAAKTAHSDILQIIHNPLERTKFDMMTQAFIPFNYSYIQFIKRWGRAFEDNPNFARRLQIMAGVGQHDGWFDQDPHGNLLWHLPVGPAFMQHYFSIGLQRKEDLPFAALPLEGLNKSIIPSMLPFSNDIMPGFSPIVTIPSALLTLARPSMTETMSKILGPSFGQIAGPGHGFANTVLSQVAPSWASKIGEALSGNTADNNFGKTYINLLQYHGMNGDFQKPIDEAVKAGKDLSDPAVARQIQLEQDKIKGNIRHETRLMYLVNSIESAFSPYSPLPDMESMKLPSELRQLRTKYGPELGYQKFVDKYGPNAEMYVKGITDTLQKGSEPSKEYQNWAEKNGSFLNKYPNVAGMLGPHSGQYNQYAYQEQLDTGATTKLNPNDWLLKVAARGGDDIYYNKVQPAVKALQDAGVSQTIVNKWRDQQIQKINLQYPGWLDWRLGGPQREEKRKAAIGELQSALNDPEIPKGPNTAPLRQFIGLYNVAKADLDSRGISSFGSKSAESWRTILVAAYDKLKDPHNLSPLDEAYQLLFRSELQDFTHG